MVYSGQVVFVVLVVILIAIPSIVFAVSFATSHYTTSALSTFFGGVAPRSVDIREHLSKFVESAPQTTLETALSTIVADPGSVGEVDTTGVFVPAAGESLRDPAKTFAKKLSKLTKIPNPEGAASTAVPIPKQIFMVEPFTRSGDTVKESASILETIKAIRSDNPDYTVNVYTEAEVNTYMADNAPPALAEAYLACNNEYMAVQLFKFFVIFKEGGVFFDSDFYPTKPLSKIIAPGDEFLLADYSLGGVVDIPLGLTAHHIRTTVGVAPSGPYCTKFLISVPGHPYLREYLINAVSDIATADAIYASTKAVKFSDKMAETVASYSLRGLFGKEFLTGATQFTRAVAPLAIGARRGETNSLVEIPRHRWIGSTYAVDFPMKTNFAGAASKARYYLGPAIDGAWNSGKLV
jgi:hypothetical protein